MLSCNNKDLLLKAQLFKVELLMNYLIDKFSNYLI